MYVVMNELNVPKERKEMLASRFGKSAENMEKVPGCLEFMFLSNENEDEKQVVFTKWERKEDYENWLNSDAFKQAHAHKSKENGSESKPASSKNELHAYTVVHSYQAD
ncbi:antibiotic biosynthesis monooxygenase family protein [Shouchella shacheensis]|uniref:antibiotic biosynthesis monooxygenase family protein n=1 Tax=Shouchella shacheensis TaxID=1649580 RepID=UPI00073FDA98|nr:antibiotic biosynthesis monooxygenase [Shouchella shacheensis]